MTKNFLSINDQLHMGQFLMSNSRQYKAIFQDDGNFVVYACANSPHKAVWATGTNGSDAVRVIMQADGNLVMYNQSNQPKWSSGTYIKGTCDKCRVELTDGGKLELTRTVTEKVWHS
ncbi:mannose-specific lectin-like [Perca fluviatilis]|uniref:mannose-specific lectin-like n=1 Tax=Perca fluviatilis TaxID=8168 RepID=UPI001963F189|nr:mannose-specific lectin-like [Perca fluviatilis]